MTSKIALRDFTLSSARTVVTQMRVDIIEVLSMPKNHKASDFSVYQLDDPIIDKILSFYPSMRGWFAINSRNYITLNYPIM